LTTNYDLNLAISAGNKVVTGWTARGTHRGPWMGVEGTGKQISLAGINIYTIRRGKFVESRVNWDLLGLMQPTEAACSRS
jgi:predicted ester cyclase